jgi:hypothetical protein
MRSSAPFDPAVVAATAEQIGRLERSLEVVGRHRLDSTRRAALFLVAIMAAAVIGTGCGGAEQSDAQRAMADVLEEAGGWELTGQDPVFRDDSKLDFQVRLRDRLCDVYLSPSVEDRDVVIYVSVKNC